MLGEALWGGAKRGARGCWGVLEGLSFVVFTCTNADPVVQRCHRERRLEFEKPVR